MIYGVYSFLCYFDYIGKFYLVKCFVYCFDGCVELFEYRGSRYCYYFFIVMDVFKDIKSLGNFENGFERISIEVFVIVDIFVFINMFDIVFVFVDSFYGIGFFVRNWNEYDGVVWIVLMVFFVIDISVVVNFCLFVFLEMDGIFGVVYIVIVGYIIMVEVGYFIVNLYVR